MAFLGKQRIEKIVSIYDENVKLNVIVDAIDGFALNYLLNYLDEKYLSKWASEKLSPSNQSLIIGIIDDLLEKDFEGIELAIESFSNEKIDIPGVDEIAEKELIHGVLAVIKSFIENKVK
jgi:hypothetical protein